MDAEREKARLAGGKEAEDALALPMPPPPEVTLQHFDEAFKRVQPSVSASDQRRYDELRRKLRRERGTLAPAEKSGGGDKGGGGRAAHSKLTH